MTARRAESRKKKGRKLQEGRQKAKQKKAESRKKKAEAKRRQAESKTKKGRKQRKPITLKLWVKFFAVISALGILIGITKLRWSTGLFENISLSPK